MRGHTIVRVDSEYSEEFEFKARMHFRLVLSHVRFMVVLDVFTVATRGGGVLSEMLYSNEMALMCDTIEGLMIKVITWKETFESKVVNLSLGESK